MPISNWDDMIDVGTRSAYVASAFAARRMVARRRGLIANISSSGAAKYAWHVAYGVGKAALDRLTADTAHELRDRSASRWCRSGPGSCAPSASRSTRRSSRVLERDSASRSASRAARSPRSRPIPTCCATAGARSPRAISPTLYGFTDVDGSLPDGPLEERPARSERRGRE